MWKTYSSGTEGNYKLEVRLRHPKTTESKSEAIHELCHTLLHSSLFTELRLLNPAVSFTFCPSQEGRLNDLDKVFARCFSTAVVTRYCVGDTHSRELERMRDDFLNRNNTKYLYAPMVAAYTAADIAERYQSIIEKLLTGIALLNGDAAIPSELIDDAGKSIGERIESTLPPGRVKSIVDNTRKKVVKEVKKLVGDDTPHRSKNPEENKEAMKLSIAIACWLTRAFTAYAPAVKKQLEPKLKELNQIVLRSRLLLASQAYMSASQAPIDALEHLHSTPSPTPDDMAVTINSFGALMQSTLPLFSATLSISDAEFTHIPILAAFAGASLLTTGSAGIWALSATAGALGPLGLLGGAAIATVAFGTAAIVESVKWGERQRTNPSALLLTIQKTLEECARFLLGLLFMSPDEHDRTHLDHVQALKAHLSSDLFLEPGYMKTYYKTVGLKLAHDMKDLAAGLRRCQKQTGSVEA